MSISSNLKQHALELNISSNDNDKIGEKIIEALKDIEPTHTILERHTDLSTGEVRHVMVETFNDDFKTEVGRVIRQTCRDCRDSDCEWDCRRYE